MVVVVVVIGPRPSTEEAWLPDDALSRTRERRLS